MSIEFGLPLFPIQAKAFNKMFYRADEEQRPSILWAGRGAGKTSVCQRLSQRLEYYPQLAIGESISQFEGFLIDEDSYFHPSEITLEFGEDLCSIWEILTPKTVVFIDNLFELPYAEDLFNKIANVTGRIIAMTAFGSHKDTTSWPIAKYVNYYIGPYSTWEMNRLYDGEALYKERPKGLDAAKKFDEELVVSVDKEFWKPWFTPKLPKPD